MFARVLGIAPHRVPLPAGYKFKAGQCFCSLMYPQCLVLAKQTKTQYLLNKLIYKTLVIIQNILNMNIHYLL